MYTYICIHICMCIYIYIYIYMYTCVCVCACACVLSFTRPPEPAAQGYPRESTRAADSADWLILCYVVLCMCYRVLCWVCTIVSFLYVVLSCYCLFMCSLSTVYVSCTVWVIAESEVDASAADVWSILCFCEEPEMHAVNVIYDYWTSMMYDIHKSYSGIK